MAASYTTTIISLLVATLSLILSFRRNNQSNDKELGIFIGEVKTNIVELKQSFERFSTKRIEDRDFIMQNLKSYVLEVVAEHINNYHKNK